MTGSPDYEAGVAAGRAAVAEELEREAKEYETQFGVHGNGGHTAAVLVMAAQIARGEHTIADPCQPNA